MAAHLRTATAFKISRTLFSKDDGSPYRFYYENDSDDLRCILRKGLGYLVNDPAEADILLCEKKTDNRITQGYLPVDFIVDCVKRNAFLNVDTYRTDVLGLNASSSKDESLNSRINGRDDREEEGDLMKFSEPVCIRVKPDGLLGRKKYSDLDDFHIINYLIQHKKYTETGGNAVWRQMELVKTTDHPYQSMKARFQKKIRPEIDTYNISDSWKAKLRGDCTDDGSGGDEESGEDMSFDYIDKWKDALKKCSNKKRLKVSAGVDEQTLSNGSSARTVVNDLPSAASGVTSEASPLNKSAVNSCGKAVAHLNGSELGPLTVSSSNKLVQVEAEHCDKANSHSGNLMESTLHQPGVNADEEQGTQNADYIYDDMDCLILSEANKGQNVDGAGTVSNQPGGSGTGVTTRKQSKVINNFSGDEMSPINSNKVSQHPYNNTEKRDTRTGKVIMNIYCNNAKITSSENEEGHMKSNESSDQQKETSDEVVEVSTEHVNSINTILNIIKKGSSKSRRETHSLLSKNHSSKVKDIESDTCYNAKPAHTMATIQNHKSRSISPKVQSEHVHPRRMRQEEKVDKNNLKESVEKSHKELATRIGSVSKSRSNSNDSVEETSLHIKAPMPNYKSRHASLVVKDIESDTCYNAKPAHTMAAKQNRKSRSISPKVQSEHVHPKRMRQEEIVDKNNVKESVEKSHKTAHKEIATRKGSVSKSRSNSNDSVEETSLHIKVAMSSGVQKERAHKNIKSAKKSPKKVHTKLANRKASVSKSHSDSDDSVEETSKQRANSSSRFLNATFSTTNNKRVLESDESYDDSSSVNYSPHKKKRMQHCSEVRPATASARLSHESLQSPPRKGRSSDWCSKEETMFRVEYLSKVYALEVQEAALLLKMQNGNFQSTIKYLDS